MAKKDSYGKDSSMGWHNKPNEKTGAKEDGSYKDYEETNLEAGLPRGRGWDENPLSDQGPGQKRGEGMDYNRSS